MKNVLWIGEKYCDGNRAHGESNSAHNFINTFRTAQTDWTLHELYIEERPIDLAAIPFCQNHKINLILVTLLGDSPLNASYDTYRTLEKMGTKVCILWPDTNELAIKKICELSDIALHVSIDSPTGTHIDRLKHCHNHITLWTPEDETLYFPSTKDIDASFLGTKSYPDRYKALSLISSQYPNVFIGGGQREQKLTPEDYASIVRRSKIGINFSLSPTGQFHQLKGRTLEYLATGALLLESENSSTRCFFKPGVDYVEFFSLYDLCSKINYYLAHEEERLIIARNGHSKFKAAYSAKHFWDKLLGMLNLV